LLFNALWTICQIDLYLDESYFLFGDIFCTRLTSWWIFYSAISLKQQFTEKQIVQLARTHLAL